MPDSRSPTYQRASLSRPTGGYRAPASSAISSDLRPKNESRAYAQVSLPHDIDDDWAPRYASPDETLPLDAFRRECTAIREPSLIQRYPDDQSRPRDGSLELGDSFDKDTARGLGDLSNRD